MADKAISELIAANQVTPSDLFVLEQSGTAKKLTGQILENWLVSFADGHGGIHSIVKKSTSGLVDTYRITLADTTIFDFLVTNGKSVDSITKESTSGLVDTYRINFNDNTSQTYTITNGAKGDKGDNQYVWIKYASQEPTAESHSFGDVADDWIGIYSGESDTAPTDWQRYEWFQIKGEKGDTGEPATVTSNVVEYQAGDSGTVIPSGAWSSSVPVVSQGKYLWSRTTTTFNSGSSAVTYSVSRMGIDGTGSVSSVAGISPNPDGDVPLTAADVGALSNTGGDLTGELKMNGQPISGLNIPTANDQAANMGFVNQQVKKAYSWNELDNADFTQFVAQAGIGGKQGEVSYAGDRWILDSGTVTGTPNNNGRGYSNITLNGTIKQKVANPSSDATVVIEMVSGTATSTYENGVVTITSNGGVIKNAGRYKSENVPLEYQPNGYGAELAECRRYYRVFEAKENDSFGIATARSSTTLALFFDLGAMRVPPTTTFTGKVKALGSTTLTGLTIATDAYANGIKRVNVNGNGFTTSYAYVIAGDTGGAKLEFIADLP